MSNANPIVIAAIIIIMGEGFVGGDGMMGGNGMVGGNGMMGDGGIVSSKVAVGGNKLGLIGTESMLTHGFVALSSHDPQDSGGMLNLLYLWYGWPDGCYGPQIL